jgi:hypothetical protein
MTKHIAQNRAFILEAGAGKVKDESSCTQTAKNGGAFLL